MGFGQRINRTLSQVPLRWVLTVPIVLQTFGAVALVGYLSYRSGQAAVGDMANQLLEQVSQRVSDRLDNYLQTPQHIVAQNRFAVEQGDRTVNDFELWQRYFQQQINQSDYLTTITVINPAGEMLGVGKDRNALFAEKDAFIVGELKTADQMQRRFYLMNDQGDRVKLIRTLPTLAARMRPWAQQAKTSQQPFWTEIFSSSVVPSASIGAVAPIRQDGQFQGYFLAELFLVDINNFLHNLNFSPSGQVFIVERTGNLVANSTLEQPFLESEQPQPPVRLKAGESEDPLTRLATQNLLAQWPDLAQIQDHQRISFIHDRQRYFTQAIPYRDTYGLDWLIVTILPESDFMSAVYANLRRTVLLSVLTLIGALAVGIAIARSIARPILRLNQAARAITQGDLTQSVEAGGMQEVAQLSQSFQRMTRQLRQSLQAIQASEQKFSTLLDSVPLGVSVFDDKGQIVLVNRVGQAILGQGAVDNLPIDQISETYQAYIAGTDQLYPTEQLPAVRALQGDGIIIDDVEIAVNGRRVPLEVHTIPVFDANGDVIYAINAFQDVTERRRAEQLQAHYNRDLERQVAAQTAALQASEARRRAILSAIPDQILLVNRQGTYLDFMSPASDPFPKNGQPPGQTLFQRLPEAVASGYLKAVQLALDGDDQQIFQQHRIDPTKGPSYSGDRFRYEEVRVLPCGDDTALVLVRDVTERHEVNRMKDEFISIVTHELKTPLTSIRASLGLLDSGLLADDPETTQRMLHVASQSSDRLVRLVNDILNLERLESGKVQLVMQPCPIDSLMQQAVQAMEAIALESSVTLSIEALPEQVWAAPDAIVQTLINLVCNAIKYSPDDGTVWLKAEKVDEWAREQVPGARSQVPGTGFQVLGTNNSQDTRHPTSDTRHPTPPTHPPTYPSTILFSITDQGRGIPADKLETIFGRFQQIDSSDSREKGGTGLGLAICKSIIQQHGGRIWATSELNQGSTFYFTLPSVPSDSEKSP